MALRTGDEPVQRALQILDQQAENMSNARATILNLQSEIDNGIKCAAATRFHAKMQDWLERYDKIRAKFDDIRTDLHGAHGGINDAHDEAIAVGSGSFGGGNPVYQGLR